MSYPSLLVLCVPVAILGLILAGYGVGYWRADHRGAGVVLLVSGCLVLVTVLLAILTGHFWWHTPEVPV